MCKPIAEGGQRCAGHTRPAYEAAAVGTPEWDKAAAEYASTPTGHDELSAQAEQTRAQVEDYHRRWITGEIESNHPGYAEAVQSMTALDNALTRGTRLREANKAVADLVKRRRAYEAQTSRLTATTAASIINRVRETGGLTVTPGTGAEPTSGYCINEVGACPKVPEGEFFNPETGQQAIEAFLTDYADWFDGSDRKHIGFWHDKDNGVVVMDRVDVVEGLDAATALGKARNQRSMWDVAAGREINLQ